MTAGTQTRMRQLMILMITAYVRMVCSFMQQRSAISGGLIPGPVIKGPSDDITQCRKSIRDRDNERRNLCNNIRHHKVSGVRLSMSINDESAKVVEWTVLKEGHLYLPKGMQ